MMNQKTNTPVWWEMKTDPLGMCCVVDIAACEDNRHGTQTPSSATTVPERRGDGVDR